MDLSQYLEQGELDSHGKFTMDPVRARELLRDYALPNPRDYVLSLVSFLVGMKAHKVVVTGFSDRLEIAGHGLVLPPETLANPLEGLFSGRSEPVLRELALGMNAALGLAKRVILRSGGLEGRYDQKFVVTEWTGEETLLVVECRPAGELQAVEASFSECGVEVWVQGKRVSSPLAAPTDCFVLELGGSGLWVGAHPARHVTAHPAPLQASCWIGALPSSCCWVYLGRSYLMPMPWSVGELGLQLWIACDQLDRDLSLQQIVENQRYQNVCEYVRQQLARGLDEVVELFLGGWRPTPLRPLVLHALEQAAAKNQPALALELQQALGADTPLDRFRLALLERRAAPEIEGTKEELWEAARAHLAMRGPLHHQTSQLLFRAGEKAYQAEDFALAARCFGPYLATDPVRSEEVRAQYGRCLLHQGQLHEARHHLTRAVRGWGQQEWVVDAMENLAAVDAALGCPEEALNTLVQVLERRQGRWGRRSPALGLVLHKLIALSSTLGHAKELAHYQKWVNSLEDA